MVVDLYAPASWQDCSQRELELVFRILAAASDRDAAKIMLLFRLNGISVVGRQNDGCWLLMRRRARKKWGKFRLLPEKQFFEVSALKLAEAVRSLAWLGSFPDSPVRLDRIGRCRARDAHFGDISFEDYLILDNLYQAFISSQDGERVDDMTEALYGRRLRLCEWRRLSVFFWVASAKTELSRRFRNFLRPVAADGDPSGRMPDVEQNINTQIRALTKGDITKREMILSMPCTVALAELDALAREYEDFKKKYK